MDKLFFKAKLFYMFKIAPHTKRAIYVDIPVKSRTESL